MWTHRLPAVVLAAAWLVAACSETTAPGTDDNSIVAMVSYSGTRPLMHIQEVDGDNLHQVHFNGATDPIPGNSPAVPPLTDDNLKALGPMRWSPDGSKLAFVATLAFDQSEVVVMTADGSAPRVASVNSQIILSDVEWSADGRYLAYSMSTLPLALGVEIFLTDLDQNQVKKLTTGSGFGGNGAELSIGNNAGRVYYSRAVGSTNSPVFNRTSEVRAIDVATGQVEPISTGLLGEVNAIARDGSWVVLLRNKSISNDSYDRQLIKRNLATGQETVLVAEGPLQYADLLPDQQSLLVVSSADGETNTYGIVSLQGGKLSSLPGIAAGITRIAVYPKN